jgi:glyoxylase-like metal-dependent hydrolase (beta-lactamase superfamily II)
MTSALRADLHVMELIPIATPKPLPFGIPQTWSRMASTLISGDKEAILIDPPLTIKQGHEISAWIKGVLGPSKKFSTIYITHGHGDHYFAATTVFKQFPDVKVLATKATAEHMAQQIESEYYAARWEASFPGELEKPFSGLVKALEGHTIDLEGHAINIIEAGHSDTQPLYTFRTLAWWLRVRSATTSCISSLRRRWTSPDATHGLLPWRRLPA